MPSSSSAASPFLEDLLLELGLDLLDDLLDARRVDAAVDDQALEGDAGDLAAEGVEAGEDDRLGRVVDDQVDAGRRLEGADVAPLAADDAALHLVVGEHDDRDGGLGDVVRGRALDGHADDALRLLVGLLAGLVLDALDDVGGLDARPRPPSRAPARRAACWAVRPAICSSLVALLVDHPVELGLLLLEALLAAGEGAVALAELLARAGRARRSACRGCLPSG